MLRGSVISRLKLRKESMTVGFQHEEQIIVTGEVGPIRANTSKGSLETSH